MQMSAFSTGWTFSICLPICLFLGGSFPNDHELVSHDLRVENDYFLGAVPIKPEKWVTSSDHPESLVGRIEVGEVGIAFDIAVNGRVVNCRVTDKSGNSRLDSVPCKLVIRRARFNPLPDTEEIQPTARGQMRFRFSQVN